MSFFSTWEDESPEDLRRRAEAEMLRRKAGESFSFHRSGHVPNDNYTNIHQQKIEKEIVKLFDSIAFQINKIESDYKTFNSEWGEAGRAACFIYNVLNEHITAARHGVEIAKQTCLDLSKH
jgi:hypothetical protein